MGNRIFHIDWLVIIPAIILVCLGLVTLLSIDPRFFNIQLVFALAGLVIFWAFSRVDFSVYQYVDVIFYLFSVGFLLLSYLGPNVRGATRWLDFGPISIQPSELVKPFFLLAISSLMVRYPPVKIKNILLHCGLFAVVFLVIVRQPDLGSALVYLSMWLGLLVLGGLPLKYIFGATGLAGISLPVIYELLHEYQKKRISTFLNPLLDPKGAGYNAIQAMISVGSGQLFGRGFGRGTQSLLRFLPERHTDFIFASFSEEFGLIGSLILLLIFFFMFLRLLKQASRKVNEPLAYLYISGLFIQLFTHVVINVGMNIGIVPITGITLPFVSAGGSSLITVFIGLGIYVSAIQRQRPYETARPSGL